ncbi:MAG: hypothetical protein IJ906_15435 [Oscillospiraceae bacterium]|nr:hypothetical protein [Oscillospiraceae bacterium]
MNYALNIDNRKDLVKKIEALTGLKSRYTMMPRCAYEIGAFTVEKDGRLTVADDTDQNVIDALLVEQLIVPASCGEDELTTPAETESATEPETDVPADEDYVEIDVTIISDTDELNRPELETATEEEQPEQNEQPDSGFPLNTEISFPLTDHTVQSLTNLICMIHSRGALISKATSGEFYADQTLVNAIAEHEFRNIYELIAFIREWEETNPELKGIYFADDKLIFSGFGAAPDAEHMQTFTKLAAAMNRMAITQKRVQAKDVDDSSEKYAMRIWLVRIGFGGAEYKTDRHILMEHLTGHSAFRNDEEKAKWTERQKAKRDAAKVAKNAETVDQTAEEDAE